MDNNQIKELIKLIKESSDSVSKQFETTAYAKLAEKVMERKKEISKTLFAKGSK